MADIEVNFPVRAKLTRVIDDTWTVELFRLSDNEDHWLTTFREVNPTELYTKFGVKVERTMKSSPEEGERKAKEILSDALTGLGSRTIVTVTEVENLLLDLQNELSLNDD